jgi:uncharacterized protein (DUF488 family)
VPTVKRIHSIGHGARPLEEFLATLADAEVRTLADIRTAPRSRRHPHFDGEALAEALREAGIEYVHLRGLGGWRRSRPDSPNLALRSPGFRGYADHLASEEFARDYARLVALAADTPTAYMCAEKLWWRCHRQILSDRLVVDGWEVVHLVSPEVSKRHELSGLARVVGGVPRYDRASENAVPSDVSA